MIPYRIAIEIAMPDGTVKKLDLEGQTPETGDVTTDVGLLAAASNALIWQSNALAHGANAHEKWDRTRIMLNLATSKAIN